MPSVVLLAGPSVSHAAYVKSGYAPVEGIKIYYEIRGNIILGKRPLVLLHGGDPTIETSFGTVIDEFAKHRQVIAFEQRGHGHTADVPGQPFTFEQSADDAAALLATLEINQADFFGYSNGGSIALQIAIRHPEIVGKLIVASGMYKRDGMTPEFWEGMKKAALDTMPAEFNEAYLKTAPNPNDLQSYFDKSVQRMLTFQDWSDESIRNIQTPTLILIGDHDVARPENAVEMLHLLRHGELAILPGTDHMSLAKHWPVNMIESFLDAPK